MVVMSPEQYYLQPTMKTGLRTAIQILIPIILVLASVRIILVTAKTWLPLEYRMSGFPVDTYGFSTEDRIYWSAVDIEYLLNEEEIEYFEQFTLENGAPMHNERELRHMVDVIEIVIATKRVLQWGFVVLVGLLAFAVWSQGLDYGLTAIRNGALWSLILIGVLIIGVIFAFGFVFVGFHRIFFESGTWTFSYADTFIRLYPQRFWRDIFFFVGGLVTVQAGGLYFLAKVLLRKTVDP
jgi:integral membrane protein (TIGR01906 family)